MHLTLSRDALLSALDRAGRVVERKHTIPILSNVLLRARDGHLVVTGTDLDMEVTTRADADVGAPGETTLPATLLGDFVKRLPSAAQVIMEQKAGEPRLTVRSGRSRATLNTLSPADFPVFSAGAFPASFSLPAKVLLRMIERVSFAISTEETRYYLNGIYLHLAVNDDGPTLRAVTTDGHRLALQEIMAPEGSATALPGVIVPRKAVAEIARLAKVLDEEPVQLAVSLTKIQMTAGVTTLASKLIDGTFPDYARVIPQTNEKMAVIEQSALAAAVERVGAISTNRGHAVKFSFQSGALGVSVRNVDTGDATDDLDISYEAEPLEIGFNGSYVLDLLKALPGTTMQMALADPGSPALITAEGHPECRFVLMPMRV
ncbi:DNA polymerase III subunit beta [Xanthobacter sediminis]